MSFNLCESPPGPSVVAGRRPDLGEAAPAGADRPAAFPPVPRQPAQMWAETGGSSASRSSPYNTLLSQRLQVRLDPCPARLQKWRQGQALAEMRGVLVGRKAGAVGGDLKQDAAGFAEV